MQTIENYIKNRRSFCRRTTTKGIKSFLEKTVLSYDKFYHFTDFETLKHIVNDKTWKFNSLDKVNDQMEPQKQEGKWANRVSASFSHGDEDNIGMWKMYGKNDEEDFLKASICITLPHLFFRTWINKINTSNEIQIQLRDFFVRSEGNCNNDAPLEKIKASMYDMVYYYGNREDENALLIWENTLKRMNGNKGNLKEIVEGKASNLIGYIKNSAWEYERESRISLVAPNGYELNPEKRDKGNYLVSIDPESYNILLNSITICLSPFSKCSEVRFFQESIDLFRKKGINLLSSPVQRCFVSFFRGKVFEKDSSNAPYQKASNIK